MPSTWPITAGERYTLRLGFYDGKTGDIDLAPELWGEVFESVKDVRFFKVFKPDHERGTVVWPNGADFAPEFLGQSLGR
jgi:hypothetical protein